MLLLSLFACEWTLSSDRLWCDAATVQQQKGTAFVPRALPVVLCLDVTFPISVCGWCH